MRYGKLAILLPALVGLSATQAHALDVVATFSNSILSDPNASSIEASINGALSVYNNTFTNNITVPIYFNEMSTGLGQSGFFAPTIDYSTYQSDLLGESSISALIAPDLPVNNPIPGNGSDLVQATTAQIRAIGDTADGAPEDTINGVNYDSEIDLNTSIMNLSRTGTRDPNDYDIVGVVEHEVDEVLGLSSGLDGENNSPIYNPVTPGEYNEYGNPVPANQSYVDSLDFYRYSAPGVLSYTNDPNATPYFSIDQGVTNLVGFNQQTGGDFHDWISADQSSPTFVPQVQDAYGTKGVDVNLGPNEVLALQSIGYNLAPSATAVPEASSFALLSLGLLPLGMIAKKRLSHRA